VCFASTCWQAPKKADLRKLVPRWLAQDGTVLITSYGVFCNAVKEPTGAAAARLGHASSGGGGAGGSFTAGATGSRLTSPSPSGDDGGAAAAAAADGGVAGAGGDGELMPPLRRRAKSNAELDEVGLGGRRC
jgi:uncharacterized membrane protein